MPRHPIDTNKVKFATGAAGGTIAYRPNEVLIRTVPLDDNPGDVSQAERVINLALSPTFALAPGAAAGNVDERLRRLISWLRVTGDDPQVDEVEQTDAEQRGQLLEQLEAQVREGTASAPLLRRARPVNGRWGLFFPAGNRSQIDPVQVARVLTAAGLTSQPNYVRFINSLQSAPNYIAPNYIAPNYIAPNYIAPNYIAPNYIAPNYIAPNYIAPNYIASGGGAGACLCEPCPDAPHVERKVPMITARRAYGPLPGPAATPLPEDMGAEIHVLDVRFQSTQELKSEDFDPLKVVLKNSKGDVAVVDAQREPLDELVDDPDNDGSLRTGRRSGLLPLLLRLLEAARRAAATLQEGAVIDDEIDEAMEQFLVEPTSEGFGANVDGDGFVDPTTNHAEFIQGIIDRILLDKNGDSVVRHHAIAGTLGDVSDADLALSIDWVVETHTDESKLQIMNLSLSGYTDDDLPDTVLADSIEDAQEKKWLIVASAGNNGSCRLAWPAALKGVVSVAAYGPCGPAFFSNYGPWVDACGPGVNVVSKFTKPIDNGLLLVENPEEVNVGDEFAPNGEATGYASWSGTSFSAPYVAAMLAVRAVKEITAAWQSLSTDPAVDESRVAERWKAALGEMISHPDLIQYPGYGTIVSSEAVKITQEVEREKNAP